MAFPVRALAPGFHVGLRAPGDVFPIENDAQLGSWMEPVNKVDADRLAERIAKLRKTHPGIPKLDAKLPATTAQLRDPPSGVPAAPPAAPLAPPAPPSGAPPADDFGLGAPQK